MTINFPSTKNLPGIDLDQIRLDDERPRALIVDDDPQSVFLLKSALMMAGFDVVGACGGEEALQKCARLNPDVILLDLMMPGMDGWETRKNLHEISSAPVMIVSALDHKDTIVRGFEMGVEDYLVKPFHTAELVARVNRLITRNRQQQPTRSYLFSKIEMRLDLNTCEVKIRGKTIYLPGKAFEVLAVLAKSAPGMVTNQDIAVGVWGADNTRTQNRIKHLIFILRQNLEEKPSEPVLILNRGGMGYRLASEGG
ncbi:MAG: response regulator transcription factor [Anaerolineaceae bacterium]|nr:response regulator transcription factor [Anaerolineaceae bacterium]